MTPNDRHQGRTLARLLLPDIAVIRRRADGSYARSLAAAIPNQKFVSHAETDEFDVDGCPHHGLWNRDLRLFG